jgi:tetratricopeptide (TPR) repeat protein
VKKPQFGRFLILSLLQISWFGISVAAEEFGGAKGTEIISLWKSGEKKEAKKLVNRWMDEDEKSAVPLVFSAILKFEEEEYKGCLSYTKKAIERDPHLAEAYFWRGRAYEAMGKYLEADNEYRAALAANKEFAEAQIRLNQVEAFMAGGASDSK